MPTFATPAPIAVTLELGAADVLVTAGDRADTVVEVRPSTPSSTADQKAAAETRVEYADGRLLVKAPKPGLNWFSSGPSIDVTIAVPAGSRLEGDAAAGKLRCRGRLGECRLKTAYGDVLLDETGPLRVDTGYGDVAVERAAGGADVKTGSGAVRLRRIDGPATIKNPNGECWVGEVGGDVRVEAGNGNVGVDRAHAGVNAKSGHGRVRIGEVARGAVVLETAHGEIEVGIRHGTAAWLDVATQHGRVRNALADADGPEPSDQTVEVRARAAAGDIVIRRS